MRFIVFRARQILRGNITQIDSSTIDGNVEFVHSQYSCILTSQVSIQFLCPTKLLIIVILLEKVLILHYSEISETLITFYFLFLHFFI